jgi:hypothetical protein
VARLTVVVFQDVPDTVAVAILMRAYNDSLEPTSALRLFSRHSDLCFNIHIACYEEALRAAAQLVLPARAELTLRQLHMLVFPYLFDPLQDGADSNLNA